MQAVSPPEIGLRESIDFRDVFGGDLTHHGPQLQDLVACQPVDHARALAPGAHEAGPSEVAQMVRGVGDALSELGRHVLDRSFPLRQQVDDLRPPAARQRLPHRSQRLEERILRFPRTHGPRSYAWLAALSSVHLNT
jgi:hypothetical protein